MSADVAISVKNVSKAYTIWRDPAARLKHPLLNLVAEMVPPLRKRVDKHLHGLCSEFYALKDISFEVKKGESVGIIGRNGSGKSTLLQIIAGTLQPTEGSVTVNGRVAALLELGSGFNPEFTGRQNVYLNASILGLTRKETEERFAAIEAFADIGDFIDQPVKTYSSGMVVRLAFAVSIHVDPEILIIDEALAVGDMYFQAKCMTAIKNIQARGVTILFVSHDINALKSLCQRGVYLDQGVLNKVGPAPEIAELYLKVIREEMNQTHLSFQKSTEEERIDFSEKKTLYAEYLEMISKLKEVTTSASRYGTGHSRITHVGLLDKKGNPIEGAHFNEEVIIGVVFTTYNDQKLSVNYYIEDEKKNLILGADFRLLGENLVRGSFGQQFLVQFNTRFPLKEGVYAIKFEITTPEIPDETCTFYDVLDNALVFRMLRRSNARLWAQVFVPNKLELIQV